MTEERGEGFGSDLGEEWLGGGWFNVNFGRAAELCIIKLTGSDRSRYKTLTGDRSRYKHYLEIGPGINSKHYLEIGPGVSTTWR